MTHSSESSQSEPRIAVFIAGDERIFFPALITLQSIQRHNGHLPLDYYICFSRLALTDGMRKALHDRGIEFVAREDFADIADTTSLENMAEGKWPREIFDNWVAPHYFAKVGYRYALKVDYDFLCVAPYDHHDLLSATADFRSVIFDVDLAKQHVEQSAIEKLGVTLKASFEKSPYTNVGFMVLNLDNYLTNQVFEKFARTYKVLREEESGVLLCEQAALSILLASGEVTCEPINPNYNVRIVTLPPILESGRADVRNLHYVSHHKPWSAIDYRWFDNYVRSGKTSMYIYRELWIRTASRDPLFREYVNIDPTDDLALLAPLVKVLRAHINFAR